MGIMGVSKLVLVGAVIAVAAGLLITFNFEEKSPTENQLLTIADDGIKKAAIIDQLDTEFPNKELHMKAEEILRTAGYDQVDIYLTEDITVDFYKELPSMDYDYIVARTHSLAVKQTGKTSVWMFTGEKYTEDKYIQYQLSGGVSMGVPFVTSRHTDRAEAENKRLFIIGTEFVDKQMNGKFQGTTLLLGGCDTMSYPYMAKSLVDRGASAIIGWYGLVSLYDNDRAIIKVLEEMLINGKNSEEAVDYVMEFYKNTMQYKHSTLRQYSTGASGASDFEI